MSTHRRDIFETRFVVTPGCWLWMAATNGGYGAYGRTTAHRASYEIYVGPIPDGMQVDHLCRVRSCVNPSHLEPVTRIENVRRHYSLIVSCNQGHEFTPENTYVYRGHRCCRKCNAAAARRLKQKRQAT